MDTQLEAVVLPVSDLNRSRHFYRAVGFRLESDDVIDEDMRIVRLTPPGSVSSIVIGTGISPAPPGSARIVLTVDDLDKARAELEACGATLDPVAQCDTGTSYTGFSDPDGNHWLLVEA